VNLFHFLNNNSNHNHNLRVLSSQQTFQLFFLSTIMLQYDDSAFYFFAIGSLSFYLIPCK